MNTIRSETFRSAEHILNVLKSTCKSSTMLIYESVQVGKDTFSKDEYYQSSLRLQVLNDAVLLCCLA